MELRHDDLSSDKQIPFISEQQLLRQDQMETTKSFHLNIDSQQDKEIAR